MADFAIKVLNYKTTLARFRKLKLKLKDRRRLNKRAAVFMLGWIQRNFDEQGKRTTTGGWEPLAPSTLTARSKGWGSYKKSTRPMILINTGDLKNKWDLIYDSKRAIVRSQMPYAIYHEKGKGRLPKRKLLPTNKMITKELRKIYGHFVRTSLK